MPLIHGPRASKLVGRPYNANQTPTNRKGIMRSAVAILFVLPFLSGCGLFGPSDEVTDFTLYTDRETYSVEDTMQVWFRNDAREPAAVDLCDATFERRVGSAWVPLAHRDECDLMLRLLALSTERVIGRSVPISVYLDTDNFEAGTYRFGATLLLDESSHRITSQRFELSE